MKTQFLTFTTMLVVLTFSVNSFAHCPAAVKEEKVCLMFDGSMIYIYDHKFEHNGPYKDFVSTSISEVRNAGKEKLNFKKAARGIYKLDKPQTSAVFLDLMINNKIKSIRVVKE